MRRRVAVVVLACLAALTPAVAGAGEPPASTWVVTTAGPADAEALGGIAIGPRDVAVEATRDDAAALARRPGVVAVEPDVPAAAEAVPDDPCLFGIGCPGGGGQRNLRRVGLESAWEVAHEAPGVVVAVIDGGVDASHPDLAGRVVAVPNGVPGGCEALPAELGPDDRSATGHGTRVAGLIAAAGNGRGIAGVAWGGVQVRAYSALGDDLRGSTADVAAAIHCAVDDGADVINLSLSAGDTTAMRNALDRAAAEGVVVVAAAGNGGDGNHPGPWPAAASSVVAVTGAGADDRRAPFANGGPWVDLAVPAVDVVSTVPGGTWSKASGTSYAAPVVSGVAALLLGRYPELSRDEVVARLLASAEPVGDPSAGRGLLDAAGALRLPVAGAPACQAGAAGWVLDAYGGLHPFGGARSVVLGTYWDGWDIARDIAAVPGQSGGYVLDGFGALHPFGGAPSILSPAFRPGWDIARAADRRADGSVVVLDGQGGLHVAGGGPALGTGGPWWPGEDLARDVAVDPRDPSRAWVLDAHGGVHLAGAGANPPRVLVERRTPGVDGARRLVVLPSGDRGYVLHADGRVSRWAAAGATLPPATGTAAFPTAPGRGLAASPGGEVVAVSGTGAVVPTGPGPCAPTPRFDADLARGVAVVG